MNQTMYDELLTLTTAYGTPDQTAALNKLWRKYSEYRGAVLYSTAPTVYINYKSEDKA